MKEKGIFIISLDFELNWGVHDVFTLEQYKDNLLGTREAIDKMLELFMEYNIKVTWATVGMLFFKNKDKLMRQLPKSLPTYDNEIFSPYSKLGTIGNSEVADPFHYGYSLIKKIGSYSGQEIATHTFSHYYCLESGQNNEQFAADLEAAVKTAEIEGYQMKSIVFPRNQLNHNYLSVCAKYGIQCYRGNQSSWIYKESKFYKESLTKRALRFMDGYLNLTGHHTYTLKKTKNGKLVNLPASCFLRPYNPKFKSMEKLKIRRIKQGIHHAAKNGEVYHLWWHPHNFGKNINENIESLREILQLVKQLMEEETMVSLNMEEASKMAYIATEERVYEKMISQSQYGV